MKRRFCILALASCVLFTTAFLAGCSGAESTEQRTPTSFGHVPEQPEPTTDVLYWALRFSVFGLVVLLFIVCRIRKSRWPVTHFPEVAGDLTTLPSDLPAPVVSVLGQRKIFPNTYLSILLDMLQKGHVTISGKYDEYDKKRELHSGVSWHRNSEPDQPWEQLAYDALPIYQTNSEELKYLLQRQEKAIRAHLDEYLLARGIFDDPPLQVMADKGQGWLTQFWWFLAAVIFAIGVGFWVYLWLPWWAGVVVRIPAVMLFLFWAWDDMVGRVTPTQAGVIEIGRWFAFDESLQKGRVSPSPHPRQPDPMLPYAVALNSAAQWINDNNALPPWFRPGGPREQTREGLYAAYRGFIGADTWNLIGSPSIKSSRSSGGGGPGDGGGG